jgi:hypothetical protein
MVRSHYQNTLEYEKDRVAVAKRTPYTITYNSGENTIFRHAYEENVIGLIAHTIVGTDIRTVVIEEAEIYSDWVLWKLRNDSLKYNMDVWLTVTPEIIDSSDYPPVWFSFAQKFQEPATWVGLPVNQEMIERVEKTYPSHNARAHLYGELILI